jgi:hypothetical protein
MTNGLEILNPTAQVSGGNSAAKAVGKSLSSLKGLRVGLLDNGMPHASDFLGHLGEAFSKRFQTPLLTRRKGQTALAAEREILEEIVRNCDVAVTGFGV